MFKVTKQGCGHSSRTERLLSAYKSLSLKCDRYGTGGKVGGIWGRRGWVKKLPWNFQAMWENDTPK